MRKLSFLLLQKGGKYEVKQSNVDMDDSPFNKFHNSSRQLGSE